MAGRLPLQNPLAWISRLGSSDAGSTHAWAAVFVPGAGWITFDPTNRSLSPWYATPKPKPKSLLDYMAV
jgi:transglutaminase-like putative cysteine protease